MNKTIKVIAIIEAVLLVIACVFIGIKFLGNKEEAPVPAEKNGEVYILYTSDVHCGIDEGFGYAGLKQVRDSIEAQGYTTILVDDGDSIQGNAIGTLSKGEAIIDLMNEMKYDVAIPGNHEFDYGMERFLELVEKSEFPYISCNFTYKDELVLPRYIIKDVSGMKIAFVGVTTPETLTSSTPKYFQDENGNYVYGFKEGRDGEDFYAAVQDAVDAARAEGADLVYVLGHLGMEAALEPYTYADVIEHTNGIDVLLDGHSHDTQQVEMLNKDGDKVIRSACGTKLACIGYSRISADKKVVETGIWSWPNKSSLPTLIGVDNEIREKVDETIATNEEKLNVVIAHTGVELTINDPLEINVETGLPVRMVRRAETNLGDFCADAARTIGETDIALIGGGGLRVSIKEGDITYGNVIAVLPFGNQLSVIRATGQQILDALEWGAHSIPGEFGSFLQVSGLSYEIDISIPSSCTVTDNGLFAGVEGERRVRNVMVGGEPIDPEKLYTVAGTDYFLTGHGDGNTAFDGAELLQECVMLDNQMLITYIQDILGGEIGPEYSEPTGQGRIVMVGNN